MSLDVREDHLQLIQSILQQQVPTCQVVVFGFRAKGTQNARSSASGAPYSMPILTSYNVYYVKLRLREAASLSALGIS